MKVLILQHSDYEHPGAFCDLIEEAGDIATIVRRHRRERVPNLSQFDILLVLGGTMDVWQTQEYPWLRPEKSIIATWVRVLRRPYLGIDLGLHLLVDSLGGGCLDMPRPEIGVMDIQLTDEGILDPIFSALGDPLQVIQWHDVDAVSLPKDTVILARSAACPVQAIRVGDMAWGIQFHPELTDDMVHTWLEDPDGFAAAVGLPDSKALAGLIALEGQAHVKMAQKQSRALYAGLRNAAVEAAARLDWSGQD